MTHAPLSNSRQAWVLVLGLALTQCISFGVTLNSFGVFTLPIMEAFRCSHEQAAQVATVFLLTMTLFMPLAGWLLDHVSPRPVMTAGAVITGLSYLLAAHTNDLMIFTTAMALSGMGVSLSTYVPAVTLITHWIPLQRQGLAFGIMLAGISAGGIIFPVLLNRMTTDLGWRSTLEAIAALVLLVCVPVLFWLARMPRVSAGGESAQHATSTDGPSIGEALHMSRYWMWIAMLTLIVLSGISVLMALVPYLQSVGFTSEQAAFFYAGTGVATFVGNLLFGALSTRWGAERTLLIGTALSAAGTLCLLGAGQPVLGMPAALLFSVIWGTTFNLANQLSPALLMETMGQRNFGSLLGIGNLISGIGSSFGPMLLGYLVDTTHTYSLPLVLCAGLMAAALLPIAWLHRNLARIPSTKPTLA